MPDDIYVDLEKARELIQARMNSTIADGEDVLDSLETGYLKNTAINDDEEWVGVGIDVNKSSLFKLYRCEDYKLRDLVAFVVEKARAEILHPEWPENIDRQVAIMMGEAGEALRAALHYVEGRDTEGKDSLVALREELIQTGAMVLRCLEHLPEE